MSSTFGFNRGLNVRNENEQIANNLAAKAVSSTPKVKSAFKDLTNSKQLPGSVKKANPHPTKGTQPFQVFSETPKSTTKPTSFSKPTGTVKKQQSSAKVREVDDDDIKLIQEYFNSMPPMKDQFIEQEWVKQTLIPDEVLDKVYPMNDTIQWPGDNWKQEEYGMATAEEMAPPPVEADFEMNHEEYWSSYIKAPTMDEIPEIVLDSDEGDSDDMAEFSFSY